MPLYEYRCKACSTQFSTISSMKDKKEQRCIQCDSKDLKEIYRPFRIGSCFKKSSYG